MTLLISVFEQGFIYAIMALGMYITYKILDFPDLTVDGSFPLGAAITAILLVNEVNAIITLPISFLAGAIVGILTGFIHVKLKVRDLLSGIIMMTALYSVNLAIAGKANLPFYTAQTIFDNDILDGFFPEAMKPYQTMIVIIVIAICIKLLLDCYMGTKSGFLLRAVGDNETIVTSLGKDKGSVKILGLSIANGLVALSGCLFAQQQRFFDISIGTGTAVIGLASVIIGTSLLHKISFLRITTNVVIGAILYKACVALAVRIGLPSNWLKFVTAALFLCILTMGMNKKKER
ncbi:MAG: ABC transporter permease [Eubacteriales bacterium]